MHSRILLSLAVGLIGSKTVNARVACRLSSSSAYNAVEVTTTSSIDVAGPSATVETSTAETSTIESSTALSVTETSETDLSSTAETSTVEISATETATSETLPTEASTTEALAIETSITETETVDATTETSIGTPTAEATTTEPAPAALSTFAVTDDFGGQIQATNSQGGSVKIQAGNGVAFTIPDGTSSLALVGGRNLCVSFPAGLSGSKTRATLMVCPDSLNPNQSSLTCSKAADNTISCSVFAISCTGMSCTRTAVAFDTFYTINNLATGVLYIGTATAESGDVKHVLSATAPQSSS